LIKTPSGRVVTVRGYQHLGMTPPADTPVDIQQRLF
jgi:Holliday junction resolvasome RuvABC ATP-dependent DNA helicase subunit